MAEIKMYVADTIDLVQKWVNEHNLDYDSIKLQCHSCDNSTSGAVFTVYGQEGNPANSKNANCAIFDVSHPFIMERIIQQLKEQREKAEKTFIKNSFIKRNCKINAPCPDTDAYLDAIGELNEAISILENYSAAKEPVLNGG